MYLGSHLSFFFFALALELSGDRWPILHDASNELLKTHKMLKNHNVMTDVEILGEILRNDTFLDILFAPLIV